LKYENKLTVCYWMEPVNVPANFEGHSFTHSWDNSGYLKKTLGSRWIRRSRSSKVVDFGTSWKRVYGLLLVRNSNLGPILHCFGDIAGFLVVVDRMVEPRLRWFGHVSRMGSKRLPAKASHCYVNVKRNQGRQTKKWMDNIT